MIDEFRYTVDICGLADLGYTGLVSTFERIINNVQYYEDADLW